MSNEAVKGLCLRAVVSLLALMAIVTAAVVFPADPPLTPSGPEADALPEQTEVEIPVAPEELSDDDDSRMNNAEFSACLAETLSQLSYQAEVDASLQQELESGAYTIDQPLVVTDPYGLSPHTAVVLFTTDEPSSVSVHVPGKDSLSDIDFTFEDYAQNHIVPVYGLYAGTVNAVILTLRKQSGGTHQVTVNIETELLAEELLNIIVQTDLPQSEKYQDGLNFTYCTKAAFDVNGDFRWYLKGDYLTSTNYDFNGNYIVAKGSELDGPVLYFEVTPLGKIERVLYAQYGCHHDIEVFSDGNILMTGSEGETVEDLIYELDTRTGKLINKLDLKTVFPRGRKGLVEAGNADWLHLNDITWVQDESNIIVSSRHQSFVACISWPDGEIRWIIGNHEGWPAMFAKYLLTPLGDDLEWPYGQHAPIILPDEDNDPNTLDILLFDNGNQRPGLDSVSLYSRIVHYRIDTAAHTVQQVWQYGKEQGLALFADARGNTTLFSDGNTVSFFCLTDNNISRADFIELDSGSQMVWQAEAVSKSASGHLMEYRVTRMPIYNDSANESVMETQGLNLIPKEVLETYGVY